MTAPRGSSRAAPNWASLGLVLRVEGSRAQDHTAGHRLQSRQQLFAARAPTQGPGRRIELRGRENIVAHAAHIAACIEHDVDVAMLIPFDRVARADVIDEAFHDMRGGVADRLLEINLLASVFEKHWFRHSYSFGFGF